MRKRINLNFDWKFADFDEKYFNENKGMTNVNIPHNTVDLPLNNFDERQYQKVTMYKKSITLEEGRAILHFEGVMAYAEVYANGVLLTSHKGGYTPFSAELTGLGPEVEIIVKVDSNEREDIPPFGYVIDYLTYGGIYREVYLEYVEESYIKNAFINANAKGEFEIKLEIDNPVEEVVNVQLTHMGEICYNESLKINNNSVKGLLPNPKLWDMDNPNLYEVLITYSNDQFTDRFGFRDVSLDESGFKLNNNLVKLVGLNRHQSYPYVGYAMPKNAQVKDAYILKYELGCNVVRSSHYPPSKHFLDACDAIGLLVFNEIPGWQHIGDEAWKEVAIQNVKEMIDRDYNHPSIFIWGVRINESTDDDVFYAKTNELARELDSTRPTGGVRFTKKSNLLEDVYTVNDFTHRGNNEGLTKPYKMIGKKAPYLVTEYNGHMFPTKKYDDELHRIEHVKRHLKVQNDSFKHKESAGAIGWCMFDYNTHKDFGAGDKICYHGVMDIFRIKKYAADVYGSFGEEPILTVCSSLNQGEYPASEVPQTTILTNCDYVKFYKNGTFIGDFYPNKDEYKYLPHPPVIINDFIGSTLYDNESFSKSDASKIKNMLNAVVKYGEPNVPLKYKLSLLTVMIKNKLSFEDLYHLFGKYVGNWGKESVSFRFEGIKNGEVVKEVKRSPLFKPSIKVEIDSNELRINETYDVTRVIVKCVDSDDNICDYSFDNLSISVEGVELIGPSEISFIGGSVGFWVKSTSEGKGFVNIDAHHLGAERIDVNTYDFRK